MEPENITVTFVHGPGHHSSLVIGTVVDFPNERFVAQCKEQRKERDEERQTH